MHSVPALSNAVSPRPKVPGDDPATAQAGATCDHVAASSTAGTERLHRGVSGCDGDARGPRRAALRQSAIDNPLCDGSGNSESLAGAAQKAAQRMGIAAKTLDMADAMPEQVARAGNLLVIASTWGDGDPPQRAEPFLRRADVRHRAALRTMCVSPCWRSATGCTRSSTISARRASGSTSGWRSLAVSASRRAWIAISIKKSRPRSGSKQACASWKARRARARPSSRRFCAPGQRGGARPRTSVRGRDQRDSISTAAVRARRPITWSSRWRGRASLTSRATRWLRADQRSGAGR